MPKSPKPTHNLTAHELLTFSVADIERRVRSHNPREVEAALPGLVTELDIQASAHKRKHHYGRMLAAFSVLVVCSVILGVATMIRSTPGPINMSFNNENLQGLTWQQVEDNLQAKQSALKVPLTIDDQQVVLTQAEAGIAADAQVWIRELKAADSSRRSKPWQLISATNYTPTVTINAKTLETSLRLKGLQTVEPVDAAVAIDGEQVIVTPAKDGWGADVEKLNALLTSDISDLKIEQIKLPRSTTKPKILTAAAEKTIAEINAYADAPFAARNGSMPDRATKLAWVAITPDVERGLITHSINEAKLTETVDAMIAYVNVTKQDQVDYRMPDGTKFTASEGRTARTVTNRAAIITAWKSGTSTDVQFSEEPFTVVDGGQFNQWILVDLSAHMAYAYVGQTVVNSFPISGGKSSTPTPTGTFRIFAKTAVQTMCGYYDGYTRSCTPNVRWISWFYPDYALHGAYWHDSFGVANVSHGCVNFRNADSQWVYEWAPVGTPVVVKY